MCPHPSTTQHPTASMRMVPYGSPTWQFVLWRQVFSQLGGVVPVCEHDGLHCAPAWSPCLTSDCGHGDHHPYPALMSCDLCHHACHVHEQACHPAWHWQPSSAQSVCSSLPHGHGVDSLCRLILVCALITGCTVSYKTSSLLKITMRMNTLGSAKLLLMSSVP